MEKILTKTRIGKRLEKFFGTEQYYSEKRVKDGKNSTRITNKKGSKIDPDSYQLADDLNISRESQIRYGSHSLSEYSKTLKNGIKSSAVDSMKSSVSGGLTDIFTYAKDDGVTLTKSFKAAVGGAAILASAPVWVPIAVGVTAATVTTIVANDLDKKFNITKKLKNSWINFVKG